ncbi:hypothetical protein COW57_04300, partial [Candidatus Roizmanbacteria bacterium CG17_big_fil_post_rev_8_21_14_2_50_39_7]
GESATGAFCPMPIGIKQNEDGRREIVTSPYVYLNFIDGESISQTGQNSEQHEEWHAIEMMRQVIYNTEMQQDPSLRVDSLQSTNKQKFEKRLHSFFLNPRDMTRFFESIKEEFPSFTIFLLGKLLIRKNYPIALIQRAMKFRHLSPVILIKKVQTKASGNYMSTV